jgi:type IV pilus assembly protein PilQ
MVAALARSRHAWWALAALPLLWWSGMAHAQQDLQLTDLEVSTLPGNRVVLVMTTSGPAPEPLSFTIENPARISLDLPGTGLGIAERRRDVKRGVLDTVMLAEAQGRTRVVLNLDMMVPYETSVEGNRITVTLGGAGAAVATARPGVFGQPSGAPSAAAARVPGEITGVDFRRGADGAGRVVVTLSDPAIPVDIREEMGRTVVDFRNASLPDAMLRRLDVLDFATPVQTVDSVRYPGGARLVINVTGDFEQLAYQADDTFSIEFRPVERQDPTQFGAFDERKEYTGQRLTLNFQDIEVRAVLQLLAETSGLNVVVSDSVRGNVTLRLDSVPWDQAMDIILTTRGLGMRQVGNVILVAPAAEIAARERQELESKQDIQQLAPLRSEFLQVNYAKASDLASLLRGAGGGAGSLLSERGSVSIDERTNTLLIYDTAERIADVRRLVAALDIPVRQVLIESRIVVANDDFSRDLGVRMGVTYVTDRGQSGLISVTGSGAGSDTIVSSGVNNINQTGTPFPVQVPSALDRYNVNLPIANPAGRIGMAILGQDTLIDLELSAAQAEGRGEIVSSPRVITANQKQAVIEQGVEIPFQEAASSGATTTQFKKAVLSLTVTPQITPDDRIIMDLEVTQDNGWRVRAQRDRRFRAKHRYPARSLPRCSSMTARRWCSAVSSRRSGAISPGQGAAPGRYPRCSGRLFKLDAAQHRTRRELLIFVTPKILREGSNIY